MKKKLKGHDPAISVYVDDIGITASRVSLEKMEAFKSEAIVLLEGQSLPPHKVGPKLVIRKFSDSAEHLGVRLGKRKLSLGREAKFRATEVKKLLKATSEPIAKRELLRRYRAHQRYKKNVRDASSQGL